MKKYLIILALGLALTGCGKDKSARDRNEEEAQGTQQVVAAEETVSEAAEASEAAEEEPEAAEATAEEPEAAEEKDAPPADYGSDLSDAKSSDKGSTDTLSGRYNIQKDGQIFEGMEYVFMKDTYSITETGTYSMGSGEITMQHGSNPEGTYKVEAVEGGYNLTSDPGILIPLTYKEGTDGLAAGSPFEGVYSMGDAQGYVFHSDGTMETVTTDSLEVMEGTVSMGGQEYDWKSTAGGIELSTNGTLLYTFVPAE